MKGKERERKGVWDIEDILISILLILPLGECLDAGLPSVRSSVPLASKFGTNTLNSNPHSSMHQSY